MLSRFSQIRPFNRIPLKLFLTLPFLIEMFIIVGIVGWFSVRNGRLAVNRATTKLRQETTARIKTNVSDLLKTSQQINDLTVRTIRQENLDLSNILILRDLYWRHLNTFQTVKGMGVGNRDGDIMGMFQRVNDDQVSYFLEYSNAATQGNYVSHRLNDVGQIVESVTVERQIDARDRPWYTAAAQANGSVWTEVYTSVSEVAGHSLAINVSHPISDAEGKLRGVVSVIVDLGQISQFLESIEFSPSGEIYILAADGYLIGSSDGRNPVKVNGEAAQRLPAIASQDPLIRASAEYLQTSIADFSQLDQPLQLDVDLLGERHFLQVTPLQDSSQLDWFIVVAAPESDFLAEINTQKRLTLAFCAAAFVISAGLSYLTSRWVVRPLNRLNRGVRAIAQGDLRQTVQAAHIDELHDLADSFNQMALQLQTLFSRLNTLNQELSRSESRLKQFLEAVPIGITVHDAQRRLQYINRAGRSLLPSQRLQASASIYQRQSTAAAASEAAPADYIFDALPIEPPLTGTTVRTDDVDVLIDGRLINLDVVATPIFDEQENIAFVITAFQDITARKRAERQLIHNALHDTLTGLPNRELLNQRLETALRLAQQPDSSQFALLFLDLDRFKVVNDSLGHLVGDQMLIKIARLLTDIIRPEDTVARFGGDEYVVLLEAIAAPQEAMQVADRILQRLETPLILGDRAVVITASIGIILDTADYQDPAELLRDADIAMYQAKANGKSRYEVFTPELRSTVTRRLNLENDLRHAIELGELQLVYQPIVTLDTGMMVGCEALMRWQHSHLGPISPLAFIPIAEESGLITTLSTWALRSVCYQLADWQARFPEACWPRISVNLSAKDLHEALPPTLSALLAETGVSPTYLTLEITESVLIYRVRETIAVLEALKRLGVSLSIDDFGTGYSSLNYLYRLPVDYLKVDQSFIQSMNRRGRNYRVVETIITLSDQLHIAAIAEGIETADQLRDLQTLGCEFGQGYYFARPLRADQLTAQLASGLRRLP